MKNIPALAIVLFLILAFQPPPKIKIIHYNSLEHNHRYGTFVDATDTIYMGGCLFVFDTINYKYRRVATVTIHPIN
jgi:hypothetical protein